LRALVQEVRKVQSEPRFESTGGEKTLCSRLPVA
jgi:hypothetical protein